jgi:hypothetical protein
MLEACLFEKALLEEELRLGAAVVLISRSLA